MRWFSQQMDDRGFDQKIYTDWATGIIFGGNECACLPFCSVLLSLLRD